MLSHRQSGKGFFAHPVADKAGMTARALNLKPINYVGQFKQQSNRIERSRMKLPKATTAKHDFNDLLSEVSSLKGHNAAVSPYQLMLEDMKKRDREGLVRPTIKDIEDSIEFLTGDLKLEDKDDFRASYLAFEQKLEKVIKKSYLDAPASGTNKASFLA